MVSRIVTLLARFRQDWTAHLSPEAILQACSSAGHTWRERTLDPVTTIQLFLLQVLHGNTACTHLPHLSGLAFSASAYCQARARIPLAVFQQLLRGMARAGCKAWRPSGSVSPTRCVGSAPSGRASRWRT